jgi:hypothetical protein
MSAQFWTKAFTVEEADSLLAELEAVLADVGRLQEEAEASHLQIQLLDGLWGRAVLDARNPDHESLVLHQRALDATVGRIDAIVRDQIVGRGVRLPPGGIEQGLLDFPSTLEGRWVFLCWRRGEESVRYWHEVDGGFAGRQPVTPDDRDRLGGGAVA